jgi:hypothetical protein
MLYTDEHVIGDVIDYCLWMHNKSERNTIYEGPVKPTSQTAGSMKSCMLFKTPWFS